MEKVNSNTSIDVLLLHAQKQSEAATASDVQDAKDTVTHQQERARALRKDLDAFEARVDAARDEIEDISDEPEPFVLLAMLGMDDREQRIGKASAKADQAIGRMDRIDAQLDDGREDMRRAVERMQAAIERFEGTGDELRSTLEATAAMADEAMT